jgi:hypothetical protein
MQCYFAGVNKHKKIKRADAAADMEDSLFRQKVMPDDFVIGPG